MQGVLVLTPTRQRDWAACRRRYYLAHVIHLAASDPDVNEAVGTLVHDELALRHREPEGHDTAGPVSDAGHADPEVLAYVARHREVCPSDQAAYIGGEVDLRWYVRSKALLVGGRIDAMWRHGDGSVEIRDYKTGSCPEDLRTDFGAGIYALLVAAQSGATKRPPAIDVAYESLAGEHARVVSERVDAPWLQSTWDSLVELAGAIRSERDFTPTPSAGCAYCPYRTLCPASTAA
jgi:hypothetical protein